MFEHDFLVGAEDDEPVNVRGWLHLIFCAALTLAGIGAVAIFVLGLDRVAA